MSNVDLISFIRVLITFLLFVSLCVMLYLVTGSVTAADIIQRGLDNAHDFYRGHGG